mgnify:CR=1 FL=1
MTQFDLDQLTDDLEDIGISSAESYVDPLPPRPPKTGLYRVRALDLDLDKDVDGNIKKTDGRYPTLLLKKLEIKEPEQEQGRVVYPFKRFSTKPIQSGPRAGMSAANDLLRAFDDTRTFSTGREALQIIGEMVDSGQTFRARLSWSAYDGDGARTEIAAKGGREAIDQTDLREIYKKYTCRGERNFPQVDGAAVPEWTSPAGNKCEARADIQSVVPASKDAALVSLD